MPYCKKCGAELLADANFCAKCGTPVAKEEAVAAIKHQTFKVTEKPKVIIVNRAPGKVDVKTGAEGEVTVDLDLREPNDVEWNISQEANTITVRCRALVHPFRWSRYFASGGPRVDMNISVPKETDLDLEASLDHATVTGIKGSVKVETSVARMTLENLEGNIDVAGKTGVIDLRSVNGTVKVDSTTGPVTLENVNGTVSVRNTTGPIKFSGSLSKGENWFRTITGTIDLALTGTSDLTVEAYSRLGTRDLYSRVGGRSLRTRAICGSNRVRDWQADYRDENGLDYFTAVMPVVSPIATNRALPIEYRSMQCKGCPAI